jgi:1-deoxy-D-xylulose-5-phosphate synthase
VAVPTSILERIDGPEDLKKLNLNELEELAREIRQYLLEVVSKTGGHIAPNLGVVEITLALHYVLDSPKDKIIFDVSHQSYVHKILTGRRELFKTLRQFGGISGFTSKKESEHDPYTTGHASTSLAFAMGLKEALKRRGKDSKVAVVIGDGALTGGVAFEALNNIGQMKVPVIIILNDNEMSIDRNVGAISAYLSRIRLDPKYNRLREEVDKVLKSFPLVGETLYRVQEHIKESLKALLTPGVLFEEFGIRYIGPLDGHNLGRLILAFRWASELDEPIILHVVTKKGRGYLPAEEHPEKFHGSAPFEIETGKPVKISDKPTYTEVFSSKLIELAERDERIIAITAAMPSGTGLDKFRDRFPQRFFDVGIAEQFAVTFAAGLASGGFKPVCAIYSTFLERAYDQIIQDVALNEAPVIFAIDRGGLVGEDGPTHHGIFDISYLRSVPGIVFSAPATDRELEAVMELALKAETPFFFRYPRGEVAEDPSQKNTELSLEIGKGRYYLSGEKVAIIGVGRPVYEAYKAALKLQKEGLKATVFNAIWVKPLDEKEIEKILMTHDFVYTVEENNVEGGFGELVCRFAAEKKIKPPALCLGIRDAFITHGKPKELLHLTGLDDDKIYYLLKETFTQKINGNFMKKLMNYLRINGR